MHLRYNRIIFGAFRQENNKTEPEPRSLKLYPITFNLVFTYMGAFSHCVEAGVGIEPTSSGL